MNIKRCIEEMQHITGVITDDVDYLLYLMLKDGCKFNEDKENKEVDDTSENHNIYSEEGLDEWFRRI